MKIYRIYNKHNILYAVIMIERDFKHIFNLEGGWWVRFEIRENIQTNLIPLIKTDRIHIEY